MIVPGKVKQNDIFIKRKMFFKLFEKSFFVDLSTQYEMNTSTHIGSAATFKNEVRFSIRFDDNSSVLKPFNRQEWDIQRIRLVCWFQTKWLDEPSINGIERRLKFKNFRTSFLKWNRYIENEFDRFLWIFHIRKAPKLMLQKVIRDENCHLRSLQPFMSNIFTVIPIFELNVIDIFIGFINGLLKGISAAHNI